jgi:hypothetical protein
MTTAALQPFVQAVARDWPLFNFAQAAAVQMRSGVVLMLRVLLFAPFLVVAQFVPFIFRRHLRLLMPLLPDVKSEADLAWVKDVLVICYESLKAYNYFCVFRPQMRAMLDQVDEHLDSLEFIAPNREFLESAVARIER